MSLKIVIFEEKPVQQQGVVVPMSHVNKPGVIFPLYFVNKEIKTKTEKVHKPVSPRLDPESRFGGVY